MAAGQIYKGKNLRFSFDGKTLFHAKSCSLTVTTEIESIASKDSKGKIKVPGGYDWNMTTSALVADKALASSQFDFMDLLDAQLEGAELDVEFTTNETGDFLLSGKVFIASTQISAEDGTSANGDFSFEGNGDLTKTIVE